MKAIVAEDGKLTCREWPVPRLSPSDVLIRVWAAGVNPGDLRQLAGDRGPRVIGQDVAGTIAQVGEQALGFAVGERVCAMLCPTSLGGYAQYAAVPARTVARLPVTLSFTDAASLPVSALTAWQALFEQGQLRPEQRVLVHGAAGGVGCVAVQLALWKGAEVFGTTSAPHLAYVESLGAHFAVGHAVPRFEAVVPEVDLVIDTLGGDFLARSYALVRPGGRVVSVAEIPRAADAETYRVRAIYCQPGPDSFTLARILDLLGGEMLCAKIAGVFPLAQAANALALATSVNVQGKVVLSVC